jgi:hypothetical protein
VSALEDAIAATLASAEAHAAALRTLGSVGGYTLDHEAHAIEVSARNWAKRTRADAAEAARPKGPTVRLVYVRRDVADGDAGTAEIVRTSPKRAVSRAGTTYDLATGIEVKASGYYSRKYCIHPDDLPAVRAMKPGPNAVSKAFDAIAKAVRL